MSQTVPQPVLAALSSAHLAGNALKLAGQMDRKMYVQVAKVIELAGGKWDRKAQAHIFQASASDAVEPILLTGTISNTKQDYGQFYTPSGIAEQVIELAQISDGMAVLEPSAGRGALSSLAKMEGGSVDCIEIDATNFRHLETMHPGRVVATDFLTVAALPAYDRIVMNPPFARQADIRHVTHALDFLRPGARLVAIMSAGFTFRQDRVASEFRALVDLMHGQILPLPAAAFRSSGTDVSAVIVCMERAA